LKKKELYETIGLIIISATLYSIIAFFISLSMSPNVNLTINFVFTYLTLYFLNGLLFFGLPISIISIIIDVIKSYKLNIEQKTRDELKSMNISRNKNKLEKKYCSNCGEKIKKQATYCEFCGVAQ